MLTYSVQVLGFCWGERERERDRESGSETESRGEEGV
jgi:hypothetical protein